MAADTAAFMHPGGDSGQQTAFRRWRRSRPFWGGLLMILSGLELLASANLNPSSLQVHLGVPGFLSYIVPAFMILCGALVWATPAQRIFYGVLGTIAAIYSVISVNFGGFLLGFLLGIIGGGLTLAWVSVKHRPASIPVQRDGEPDPDLEPVDVAGRHAMAEANEDWTEGKQGERFPFPRSATSDDHELNRQAVPDSRLRTPRFVITGIVALTFAGSIGFVTLRDPQAAAAAGCTLPPITQLRASAQAKHPVKAKQPAQAKQPAKASTKATQPPKADAANSVHGGGVPAGGRAAPQAQPSPGPVAGLLGGVLNVLGLGATATPSDAPTPDPTTAPPTGQPTSPPTAQPTGTSSKSPAPSPSAPRTGAPTSGKPTTHPTVPVAPSPSCDLVVKKLAAAAGQDDVQLKPAVMKADTLTMTGLSYDGNVNLPTKDGTITVMQFSMDSSTSTPFELDVTTAGQTVKIKSSSLTVSGSVKFYATEIKGNVLGVLPADYTPTNPPPIVPPLLFFTSVTIGLEDVVCDKLTADSLTIN